MKKKNKAYFSKLI